MCAPRAEARRRNKIRTARKRSDDRKGTNTEFCVGGSRYAVLCHPRVRAVRTVRHPGSVYPRRDRFHSLCPTGRDRRRSGALPRGAGHRRVGEHPRGVSRALPRGAPRSPANRPRHRRRGKADGGDRMGVCPLTCAHLRCDGERRQDHDRHPRSPAPAGDGLPRLARGQYRHLTPAAPRRDAADRPRGAGALQLSAHDLFAAPCRRGGDQPHGEPPRLAPRHGGVPPGEAARPRKRCPPRAERARGDRPRAPLTHLFRHGRKRQLPYRGRVSHAGRGAARAALVALHTGCLPRRGYAVRRRSHGGTGGRRLDGRRRLPRCGAPVRIPRRVPGRALLRLLHRHDPRPHGGDALGVPGAGDRARRRAKQKSRACPPRRSTPAVRRRGHLLR